MRTISKIFYAYYAYYLQIKTALEFLTFNYTIAAKLIITTYQYDKQQLIKQLQIRHKNLSLICNSYFIGFSVLTLKEGFPSLEHRQWYFAQQSLFILIHMPILLPQLQQLIKQRHPILLHSPFIHQLLIVLPPVPHIPLLRIELRRPTMISLHEVYSHLPFIKLELTWG